MPEHEVLRTKEKEYIVGTYCLACYNFRERDVSSESSLYFEQSLTDCSFLLHAIYGLKKPSNI